jgi:hypothetical protein
MGLEGRTQRLLALALSPNHDHDCDWIHKGVITRAARILAPPTHHRSVDHQPHAAGFPSRYSPTPLDLIDPHPRHPDWSL